MLQDNIWLVAPPTTPKTCAYQIYTVMLRRDADRIPPCEAPNFPPGCCKQWKNQQAPVTHEAAHDEQRNGRGDQFSKEETLEA